MKSLVIALFVLIFFSCKHENNQEKLRLVVLQPLNSFPINTQDSIKLAIEDYYHFKVIKAENIKIPQQFYTTIKSPRYRADSIIHYLKAIKPDSVDYIIGLTDVDISTTKKDKNGNIKEPKNKYSDWGIFGLGFRPGVSCVISNYRVKHNNPKTYLERLKKITLHELEHNLGLPHCPNEKCFMQDTAETIKTIDRVQLNLCSSCLNRIN